MPLCRTFHSLVFQVLSVANEIVLKKNTMSASSASILNCGIFINPASTLYDSDRIGNLVLKSIDPIKL